MKRPPGRWLEINVIRAKFEELAVAMGRSAKLDG
jgi:hypothetical protein